MIRCWALVGTLLSWRYSDNHANQYAVYNNRYHPQYVFSTDPSPPSKHDDPNTHAVIMITGALSISALGGWFITKPCAQLNCVIGEQYTLSLYPVCASFFDGSNPSQRAIVEANFSSNDPNEIAAALGIPFGTAGWMSFFIHAIAVER